MTDNAELIARLKTLIGEYWDIGYTEGKNGMASAEAANAKWREIEAALQAMERKPMREAHHDIKGEL